MKNKIALAVLLITILSSCAKIGEYYLGMNLQPDIVEADFKPGLNIYGVLKTGPGFDTINHHFEVQELLFIFEEYDSMFINNAEISLQRVETNGNISHFKPLNTSDGIYSDTTIQTAPGDHWFYTCNFDSFEVKSQCTVPNIPQLIESQNLSNEAGITFTLQEDETAFMYQVYLLNGENFYSEKRIPIRGVNTSFTLKPEWSVESGINLVYVFAYDENLEKYYTTSNTFFKPNAFRPRFTTVEGGYGTFGAISSNLFKFP